MEHRIAQARERDPRLELVAGDAARLPWEDGSFDLVTQFTCLSSVLDAELRRAIAAEMWRVLRAGGDARVLRHDRDARRGPRASAAPRRCGGAARRRPGRRRRRSTRPSCTACSRAPTSCCGGSRRAPTWPGSPTAIACWPRWPRALPLAAHAPARRRAQARLSGQSSSSRYSRAMRRELILAAHRRDRQRAPVPAQPRRRLRVAEQPRRGPRRRPRRRPGRAARARRRAAPRAPTAGRTRRRACRRRAPPRRCAATSRSTGSRRTRRRRGTGPRGGPRRRSRPRGPRRASPSSPTRAARAPGSSAPGCLSTSWASGTRRRSRSNASRSTSGL